MAFCVAASAALCIVVLDPSQLLSATSQIPKRKPGSWEITTVAPVSGMTKTKVCVGPDDDIITPEGDDCTKPKVTPLNEGVIVDVTCTSKGGKQTISTAFTGDFQTRYHAILKMTFDPPIGEIKNMGVIIDGKYLGVACEGEDDSAKPK